MEIILAWFSGFLAIYMLVGLFVKHNEEARKHKDWFDYHNKNNYTNPKN